MRSAAASSAMAARTPARLRVSGVGRRLPCWVTSAVTSGVINSGLPGPGTLTLRDPGDSGRKTPRVSDRGVRSLKRPEHLAGKTGPELGAAYRNRTDDLRITRVREYCALRVAAFALLSTVQARRAQRKHSTRNYAQGIPFPRPLGCQNGVSNCPAIRHARSSRTCHARSSRGPCPPRRGRSGAGGRRGGGPGSEAVVQRGERGRRPAGRWSSEPRVYDVALGRAVVVFLAPVRAGAVGAHALAFVGALAAGRLGLHGAALLALALAVVGHRGQGAVGVRVVVRRADAQDGAGCGLAAVAAGAVA